MANDYMDLFQFLDSPYDGTEEPYESDGESVSGNDWDIEDQPTTKRKYKQMYADPETLQKYMRDVSAPMPSEGMYSEYLGKEPREENYKPSTGRRVGAALLAAAGGATGRPADLALAMRAGENIKNAPFYNMYQNWQTQGRDMATRARLADAQRTRELGAEKFGIEQGIKQRGTEVKEEEKFVKNENEMARISASQEKTALADADKTRKEGESKKRREEDVAWRKQLHTDLQTERNEPKEFTPEKAESRASATDKIKVRAHEMAYAEHERVRQFLEEVTDTSGKTTGYKFKLDTPESAKRGVISIIKSYEEKLLAGVQ